MSQKNIPAAISSYALLRYEIIILEYHLVTKNKLSVGYNMSSFSVKLSALSLILVRVY